MPTGARSFKGFLRKQGMGNFNVLNLTLKEQFYINDLINF